MYPGCLGITKGKVLYSEISFRLWFPWKCWKNHTKHTLPGIYLLNYLLLGFTAVLGIVHSTNPLYKLKHLGKSFIVRRLLTSMSFWYVKFYRAFILKTFVHSFHGNLSCTYQIGTILFLFHFSYLPFWQITFVSSLNGCFCSSPLKIDLVLFPTLYSLVYSFFHLLWL